MISPTPHQIAQLQIIFRQSRVGQPCLANPFTEQELAELIGLGLVRNGGTGLSITEHAVLALDLAGCGYSKVTSTSAIHLAQATWQPPTTQAMHPVFVKINKYFLVDILNIFSIK